MSVVTVSSLITQAKQKADMENRNFVKPDEWIQYINDGYKELYDILVSKFEDYYTLGPVAFSVATGQTSYTLPTDFYKLRGVDRSNGGSNFIPLLPFNFNDRNRRTFYRRWGGIEPTVRYRIFGNKLIFNPQEQAPGSYQLWYVPQAADITTDSQTIEGVNGWEEYIVFSAAIDALAKEESDVSVYEAAKQQMLQRIQALAANRDAGQCDTVGDVTRAGYYDDLLY